jgi:glycyl-tRNA synthetase beta subunit
VAEFLLEIGTEEIPDWMIDGALADLRARFEAAFAEFDSFVPSAGSWHCWMTRSSRSRLRM